jgi:hypothetical protein
MGFFGRINAKISAAPRRMGIFFAGVLIWLVTASAVPAASAASQAGEALMTQTYFNQWLAQATAPLETKIRQREAEIQWLENEIAVLRRHLFTEIQLTVGDPRGFVNGTEYALEAPPVLMGGRTFVPIRFIGEQLGAQVEWVDTLKKVVYRKDGRVIELVLDQASAWVDGQETPLDAVPTVMEGRMLVPLRWAGEQLGASVQWDAASQTIYIRLAKN